MGWSFAGSAITPVVFGVFVSDLPAKLSRGREKTLGKGSERQ